MPPLNIVLKQGINQALYIREEAGQVETVRNCVVYAHRDRHRQPPAFERIFAPCHHVGEKLPPKLFFRINRRFIISFESIREMVRYSGSRIKVLLNPPTPDGEEVLVSTDRVQDFRQWLNR